MKDLPNDIESLRARIYELLEKIAQFETENAKLRRRLGLDSSNSRRAVTDTTKKPPSRLPKNKNSTNGAWA